ncbi:hypothetical protein KBZ00_25905 [Streptomyces sp. RK31]|uniref:hypothetical protein n=1 Tax=Streptomyces sp. RK31 TaxID=2824892 RepID=UPI001B39A175|nr:hypothetical protein [Streptomyces sp. RK31]MBQ0974535.1 hypothetical protein [Streptomyces sp. RK31]
MSDRHTADTITDDALDQLYAELGQLYKENAAAVTALADMARKRNEQMDRADRAEAALARVRGLADRLDEFAENALKTSDRQLYTAIANDIRNHATPAATQATDDACCGKPEGALCVHDVTPPIGEQRERPTPPDGTPYRYHEITAEGWEHCDGCGLWGQWTVANPHECANDRVQPADQTKEQ